MKKTGIGWRTDSDDDLFEKRISKGKIYGTIV